MRKLKLAPSILSADFARLGADIAETERGGAGMLHVDVMDGHFVPNISIGVPVVSSIRRATGMILDVHLMISRPMDYIAAFAEAGADIINFHLEAEGDPERTIGEIKSLGKRPALTIKPDTPVEELFPYIGAVDMVLMMSVEPGFGGQDFMPSSLAKVKRLREFAEQRGVGLDIEIDGGIKLDNLGLALDAGANLIVAGSAVFEGRVYENTLAFLSVFEGYK